MGKASKNRSKEKRKQLKRAQKESRRQLYKSWAEEGKNKKSKRFVLRGKKGERTRVISHKDGQCGNIGCDTCRGRKKVCHRPTGSCRCAGNHHDRGCKCGACRVPPVAPKKAVMKQAA